MDDPDFRALYQSYPIIMGCGSSSDTVQSVHHNSQLNGGDHNQHQNTVAGYNQSKTEYWQQHSEHYQQQQYGHQYQQHGQFQQQYQYQQQYGQFQQQGHFYQHQQYGQHSQQQYGQPPTQSHPQKHVQYNDQAVRLTLEQVEQETEEETRTRLSQYGNYKDSYTILEIIALCREKGYFELFWWKDSVIHGVAFKDLVRLEVETMQEEQESQYGSDDKLNFDTHWTSHPVTKVNETGFKMSKIVRYFPKCKVANLTKLRNQEYWENIKTDADQVAVDLKQDGEITVYQIEYLELLQRFFDQYVQLCSEHFGGESINVGDPNELTFPLPKAVDPDSIRNWARFWEEFDFEVPDGGSWGFPTPLHQVFSPGEACEYIPWYDPEEPELDMEITGEAGWDVIEVDLFKNDITTPKQDEIWASREQRTDMDDEDRMKRRREQIANYMTEKYEWPPSKVQPFLSFTDNLDQGWKKFQELCEQ